MYTKTLEVLAGAGLETSHWGKRILAAAKNDGAPLDADRVDSKDWTTCACGRLDDGIPRNAHGVPIDAQLNELGKTFHTRICAGQHHPAALCLVAIEGRASIVLSEITEDVKAVHRALHDCPNADALCGTALDSAAKYGYFTQDGAHVFCGAAWPHQGRPPAALRNAVFNGDVVVAARLYAQHVNGLG